MLKCLEYNALSSAKYQNETTTTGRSGKNALPTTQLAVCVCYEARARRSSAFVLPPPNAVVFIIRQNRFLNQEAITKLPDVQSGNAIAA